MFRVCLHLAMLTALDFDSGSFKQHCREDTHHLQENESNLHTKAILKVTGLQHKDLMHVSFINKVCVLTYVNTYVNTSNGKHSHHAYKKLLDCITFDSTFAICTSCFPGF